MDHRVSSDNDTSKHVDDKDNQLNKSFNYEENEESQGETSDSFSSEYSVDEKHLLEIEEKSTEKEIEELHQQSLEKKNIGNDLFKKSLYKEAAQTYTEALRICPLKYKEDRAVFYANRSAARSKISVTDLSGAIDDCNKAIEMSPTYVKALLRRANFLWKEEKLDDSLRDFNRVLELNPLNNEAIRAKSELSQLIHAKNEKMKEELMSSLKDLGNIVLKPFGLSTNNFKLNKSEDSEGYKIDFSPNTS